MGIVVALLVFDLGLLHKDDREIGVQESLLLSAGCISVVLLFGGWVWWYLGAQSGMEYYTGFMIEKSLSMDNVLVIALIFSFYAIPRQYQHRVLFWGSLGVIGLGGTLVSQLSRAGRNERPISNVHAIGHGGCWRAWLLPTRRLGATPRFG